MAAKKAQHFFHPLDLRVLRGCCGGDRTPAYLPIRGPCRGGGRAWRGRPVKAPTVRLYSGCNSAGKPANRYSAQVKAPPTYMSWAHSANCRGDICRTAIPRRGGGKAKGAVSRSSANSVVVKGRRSSAIGAIRGSCDLARSFPGDACQIKNPVSFAFGPNCRHILFFEDLERRKSVPTAKRQTFRTSTQSGARKIGLDPAKTAGRLVKTAERILSWGHSSRGRAFRLPPGQLCIMAPLWRIGGME